MAGAAALAAVPDLSSILPVEAAAAAGTKGLVGASVFGTDRVAAGDAFDNIVQRPACRNVQRVYFKLSQFPTSANDPQPVGDLAAAGIKMIISFHPDPALTVTDYEALRAAIMLLDGIPGIRYEVSCWHEPNLDLSTFPTASSYHDYVGYYAPAVRSVNPSIPIVYIPAMTEGGTMAFERAPTYYPGPVLINRILADYYGNDHLRGIRLDAIMAVADGAPGGAKPFGLAEWGDSNDKLVSPADFNAYVNYLVGLFTSRLSSGKTNADIAWFDGGGPDNSITMPSDFKIPGFRKLYDALNR
jgi:hypothetical protein